MVSVNEIVNSNSAETSWFQAARAAQHRGDIGNRVGRNKVRGWTYSRVVAKFCELPKGDALRAGPTRARQGDRGRSTVIAYWSRRMAYLHDPVYLSRFEQRGLWCHRLQLVWPSCGQQNLGRRDSLPQIGAVGQSVSGAGFRQQVSIGVASVVQVPLTNA
jgi:hypothetical protein